MFLINTALEHISIGTAGLVALLGYAVVFLGLIFLMIVISIVGKIMTAREASKKEPEPVILPVLPPKPKPEAAGTAGEVKCFDVPDKTAAMLMAIVADQMGVPLNTLRFKSIKEVK